MVRSFPEPEWDDEQLAWIAAERLVTSLTGPNGEWMPDAAGKPLEGADPNAYSGYRYKPEGPFINWAEKSRRDAEDEHRKALGKDANMNGVYFTVKRVDV